MTNRPLVFLALLTGAASCSEDPYPYYLFDTSPDVIDSDAAGVDVAGSDIVESDADSDTVDQDVSEDTGPECIDGQGCLDGEACVEGVCVDVCQGPEDCGGGTPVCEPALGVCVECASAADCGEAQTCENYECADQCEIDEDCPGNDICEGGVCIEPEPICDAGQTECDGNSILTCVGGFDYQLEDCAGGSFCEMVDGEAICVPEAECDPGQSGCIDDETRWLCDEFGQPETFNCGFAQLCEEGSCVDEPDTCLEASPREVDFGSVRVGQVDVIDVFLSSCGEAPVTVVEVSLSSDTFFVDAPRTPFEVDSEVPLQVSFQPARDNSYADSIVVLTEFGDEMIIPLDGQGTFETPPLEPVSFHGELTWGRDSDLDNHLLRNEGVVAWESDADCHYGNTNPNWGESGSDDDPRIDVDDTDGFGPENINIAELEYGVEYIGGAYVSGMAGQTRQTATYRLYLGGALVEEYTHEFTADSQFWTIYSLRLNEDGEIDLTFIDEVTDGYPMTLP